MAGNTGKMTMGQVIARGPRMRLLSLYRGEESGVMCRVRIGFVIACEGLLPFRLSGPDFGTYARSYSLSYLLRVGRVNQEAL